MSQGKHNSRVTNKTTICWKLITQDPGRIYCSYSKLEKLNSSLNDHLAAIKSFILQKRSKNSLKCFRGQILSEIKNTGNQCWNAQETHRPHDLSVSQQRYHLLSQKQECSTAYSTHISKVQVLNDQALFLCWAWMDQGGLHCLIRFCYIAKKSLVSF